MTRKKGRGRRSHRDGVGPPREPPGYVARPTTSATTASSGGTSCLSADDAFEGDDYQRSEVLITGPDGLPLRAWTYLFKDDRAHALEPGAWDEDRFDREGKARFVKRYTGFHATPKAAPG